MKKPSKCEDPETIEKELIKSDEYFHILFDKANDAVTVHGFSEENIPGRYIEVNEIACKRLGYSKEELLKLSPVDIVAPEMIPHMKEISKILFSDRHAIFEMVHIAKDGRRIPVEISTHLLEFKGKITALSIVRDITERKKAEEEIKESKERLENALNALEISESKYHGLYKSIRDGIVLADIDGNILECNNAYLDMLGYSSDEIRKQNVRKLTPSKWHELEAEIMDKIVNKGFSDEYEKEYVRKDGSVFPIIVRKWLIKDDWKNPRATWAIVRDITERRKAEEELRLHSLIINNMEEGVYLIRVNDGVILYANPKFERMFGFEPGEIIGRHVSMVNAPSEEKSPEDKAKEISDELNRNGMWSGEVLNVRKDGSVFWCYATVSTIKHYEYGTVWAAIHKDITLQKQAEKIVKKTMDELSLILDSVPAAIWYKDLKNNFLRANRAALLSVGMNFSEIEGKPCKELFPLFAESRYQDDLEVIKSGMPKLGIIERMQDSSGEKKWVQTDKVPIKDDSGNVTGLIVIDFDITKIKLAEEALTRSNTELEQFAYVASHDLQEPLRAIYGFAQLMEIKYKGKLDKEADEYLDFIIESAVRLRKQIKELLELSRVNTSGNPFELVDCNEVLERVISYLHDMLLENDAVVTFKPLPQLFADSNQLEILFLNLIGNAVKFRREIKTCINIEAEKKDNHWVFSFCDNGIGIEERNFERIFVIFQRLHSRETYPGMGMGLSICRKIVERHNGKIWVESIPGEGSTFFFSIPVSDENVQKSKD